MGGSGLIFCRGFGAQICNAKKWKSAMHKMEICNSQLRVYRGTRHKSKKSALQKMEFCNAEKGNAACVPHMCDRPFLEGHKGKGTPPITQPTICGLSNIFAGCCNSITVLIIYLLGAVIWAQKVRIRSHLGPEKSYKVLFGPRKVV